MPKDKNMSAEDIINMMKAQFGDAVKAYWFYEGECPCCLSPSPGDMMYDNKKAMSINAFMYRERGALIAYLLCSKCANEIMTKAPKEPTAMHKAIEENLVRAYLSYLNSLA